MRKIVMMAVGLAGLIASGGTTDVVNAQSFGEWRIAGNETLLGCGGVQAKGLIFESGARLAFDPVQTPIRIGTPPRFGRGAKIALAPAHANCVLGRFTLLTWSGAAITPPRDLVDGAAMRLTCEAAPTPGEHRLILTIGDYDRKARDVSILPLGDSITEGTNKYAAFARANYRIPLFNLLAARGYRPRSLGYQRSCDRDAAGSRVDDAVAYHCGMSGQMCRTVGAAGWEDSIDVALDAAGEPDIITFKIGTNDLKGGVGSAEVLFEAWTNVITKLLVARPSAQIIVGTVLDAQNGALTTRVGQFNQKMRQALAGGIFPKGRVSLADLNAACPFADNNFADALHPNWKGHNKVAACWCEAIEKVMRRKGIKAPRRVCTTTQTAERNVPRSYRQGFVHLATYRPTAEGKIDGAPQYDFLNAAQRGKKFKRVGYYLELKRRKTPLVDYRGHVRFVWVDFEAFGTRDFAALGIPTQTHQQVVEKLHVYSNDTGIRNVAPSETTARGFIEFSPAGYTGAGSGIANSPANRCNFDWNDTIGSGRYGTLQIHRIFGAGESWNEGEVLLAFNRWSTQGCNEIGIGSFAQKISGTSIDYTSTTDLERINASAYETMSLEIWAVPE